MSARACAERACFKLEYMLGARACAERDHFKLEYISGTLCLARRATMGQGSSWIVQDEEERVRKAVEELDTLVWDPSDATIRFDDVQRVMSRHRMVSDDCIFRVHSSMKNCEAEQTRKTYFFKLNAVVNFQCFHNYKADRYRSVANYIELYRSNGR